MELSIAKSCGSCIHTNKPKKPREHAAHYEVAKTERWCYLHKCHVIRECVCDDYGGINKATKGNFTRIKTYNEINNLIIEILELIGDNEIQVDNDIYFKYDNWLYRRYVSSNYKYIVSSKSGYSNKLIKILSMLKTKMGVD